MSVPLLILGVALLSAVSWDFLVTTVGGRASGPVTMPLARAVFAALRAAAGRRAVGWLARVSGLVVMVAVSAFWILGAALSWTLVYLAFPGSIQSTLTGVEPSPAATFAHVGHLLSTLGGATTQPGSVEWNVVGVFVGLNGMIMLTMAVSFLLSTRETIRDARAFAALVASGPVEVDRHVDRLAELVASLHTAPLALFYGHHDPDRSLPATIRRFHAQARGGPDAARVRALISDLPGWHRHDAGAGFEATLDGWARAHALRPDAATDDPRDRPA
jgi:hypothetical protein